MQKLIIVSAPSGSGKSTLIEHLLQTETGKTLEFSISATCREPRGKEQNGVEYYFLTTKEFEKRIDNNDFIEYEEVYKGCYYGTLRSEIDRIFEKKKNVIFDIDVVGGVNVKKQFGNQALAIYIAPPSIEKLKERLENRKTDTAEKIAERIAKAEYEMTFAKKFDVVVVNDDLEKAKKEFVELVKNFLDQK